MRIIYPEVKSDWAEKFPVESSERGLKGNRDWGRKASLGILLLAACGQPKPPAAQNPDPVISDCSHLSNKSLLS